MSTWPHEGFRAAIERGYAEDWRRIAQEVRRDPFGVAAERLEETLGFVDESGVTRVLRDVLAHARNAAKQADRDDVTARVRESWTASGLSQSQFANRVGTSASRMSTYLSGKVEPSASMLVRMERVGRQQRPEP